MAETFFARTLNLKEMVDYAVDSVVSKTLVKNQAGTLTLFAFDAGQGLSEHTAPYDAVVQLIEGDADLMIGGKILQAVAGQMVIMPANIPHAVQPGGRFKMLLTMIRGTSA